MDLRQLEMFKTVARSGGFTRASEKLHVSHSAVSRQIKLLEGELGGPLFHPRQQEDRFDGKRQGFVTLCGRGLRAAFRCVPARHTDDARPGGAAEHRNGHDHAQGFLALGVEAIQTTTSRDKHSHQNWSCREYSGGYSRR